MPAVQAVRSLSPHSPSKTGVNALTGERVGVGVRGTLNQMIRCSSPHPDRFAIRLPPASGERSTEQAAWIELYAFHKFANWVATTSSYLPTPLVMPVACENLHMVSNVSLLIAGS